MLWRGIELADIGNILDIDINLWNWETCIYQNTADFKARYPIVKIGSGNEAYYQPTDGQSLTEGTTYTFLTMVGNSYTADTLKWNFIDGYCTNYKLESTSWSESKNNSPENSPTLEAVNLNTSTQEINGYESYIGPNQEILDRQRIHPYGSHSAQISVISSPTASANPPLPYYIQYNTINKKTLPRPSSYDRNNPLILYTSNEGDFEESDIVYWLGIA